MELIKKETKETVYTVEFTEKELAFIACAVGVTADYEVNELAKERGLETSGNGLKIYRELLNLLGQHSY